jgi:hypothetical protein
MVAAVLPRPANLVTDQAAYYRASSRGLKSKAQPEAVAQKMLSIYDDGLRPPNIPEGV